MPGKPPTYESPGPLISAVLLAIGIAVMGLVLSRWFFLGLPFAYLGLACSSANFNLADGCLVQVATVVGGVVALFFPSIGGPIMIGVLGGWILGCAERAIRARPKPPANGDVVDRQEKDE